MSDYEVGYGKPPKGHRFKPGASGNPKGRPKGAKGLASDIKSVLDERVGLEINGRIQRVAKRRLIIMALAQKAAKGDVRAADKLLNLVVQSEGFEGPRPVLTALSETDELILQQFLQGEDQQNDRDIEVAPVEALSPAPDCEPADLADREPLDPLTRGTIV